MTHRVTLTATKPNDSVAFYEDPQDLKDLLIAAQNDGRIESITTDENNNVKTTVIDYRDVEACMSVIQDPVTVAFKEAQAVYNTENSIVLGLNSEDV